MPPCPAGIDRTSGPRQASGRADVAKVPCVRRLGPLRDRWRGNRKKGAAIGVSRGVESARSPRDGSKAGGRLQGSHVMQMGMRGSCQPSEALYRPYALREWLQRFNYESRAFTLACRPGAWPTIGSQPPCCIRLALAFPCTRSFEHTDPIHASTSGGIGRPATTTRVGPSSPLRSAPGLVLRSGREGELRSQPRRSVPSRRITSARQPPAHAPSPHSPEPWCRNGGASAGEVTRRRSHDTTLGDHCRGKPARDLYCAWAWSPRSRRAH